MSDYGFVHAGRVFTPNGTIGVDPSENDRRNAAIQSAELAAWAAQPLHMLAYYTDTTVTTWCGAVLGVIVSQHVYRHNFGGQFVSLRVKATNGAMYYGRASYDNGECVRLRRTR